MLQCEFGVYSKEQYALNASFTDFQYLPDLTLSKLRLGIGNGADRALISKDQLNCIIRMTTMDIALEIKILTVQHQSGNKDP